MKLSKNQDDKKLIGWIAFEGLSSYKTNKMIRVLMNGKITTIQPVNGVIRATSLIALPNDNLVYGTYKQVYLLNENFE